MVRNWDELLHAIAANSNSVRRRTGFTPNGAHIGWYPRLPISTLERSGVKGYQSTKRDQLDYLELMMDRQMRPHRLVREEDRPIKVKHHAANEKIDAAKHNRMKFVVGDWAWVRDDCITIEGGDKHVHKPAKHSPSKQSFALICKLGHC